MSRESGLRAAPETQRQIMQAADDERFNVGERARVNELKVVEPSQDPLEADARLGAGETRARAEVLAVTEGDIAPGVRTLCIEAVGIFEDARVAVGGADHGHHDRTGRNVDVRQLRIAQGEAEGALDGTLEAQTLLDEVLDRRGI